MYKEGENNSVLIEYLGDHPIIRVIDFLIENRLFDYSKKQIAENAGIGKVTLFKYWGRLEEIEIVKVTRKFGKTKLYKLNEGNEVVKRLIELEFALADMISEIIAKDEKTKVEKEDN